MQITILSVNHHKAPIDIREKVAFDANNIETVLEVLYQQPAVISCAILSTCNRSEIIVHSNTDIKALLIDWFANIHQMHTTEIEPYLMFFSQENAINHITNVACGLNSLILGEPQILGQLKESYHKAKQIGTLDKVLEKLFQHTFQSAKYIRTHTNIGHSPISIAYCSVKLAEQIFSSLARQSVLLIGANEMVDLAIQHFIKQGIKNISIANRSLERADEIAKKYPLLKIQTISLSQLHNKLHKADIIITSTASPVPILGKGLFETALKQRKRKPIFILDIAVPRDVEPEVAQLEDIYLYTIDDLKQVIETSKENRIQEKHIAETLVFDRTKIFLQWFANLPNEELIKQYKQQAYLIAENLKQKALRRLEKGESSDIVIQTLTEQLTNKLLHQNFQNIKTAGAEMLPKCQQCVPILKTAKTTKNSK